jgi:hypothetical protein
MARGIAIGDTITTAGAAGKHGSRTRWRRLMFRDPS